ncbi:MULTISPECIES: FadR/GntR family transcriptional regulator [unclassified Cellulophaga]|uniref:FadR/GntR family transcriptional regulator n=1 Tax=unclassified Cellulophaga TaxID=2634405 RepID=UPI001C4F258C|nr:FadR/GntR family transcriptional regulator [Cellulophaga sp. HaHa_2_1]QXP51518.1 FadR family transcriptional regulator [Cellulophaga sp. HaHa_2_1]
MKSNRIRVNDSIDDQNAIISKIKEFILYKNLEPGDKLPSERELSEKFNVSRRNVREAIAKLEHYELLKSIPKTGTFIANIGQVALKGIMEGIVGLKQQDFKTLVETRLMLEAQTSFLAAQRRTEEDLVNIEAALHLYKVKMINREDALEEDLLFHLAIAKACGNSTLNALMLQITPKIISVFEKIRVCDEDGFMREVNQHEVIFNAIKDQDSQLAVSAMEEHFKMLKDFCNEIK